MTFFSGFDPDYVLRYQQWHNCEHMRERVSLPGFRTGRRYRDWHGRPWFLMLYEGDDPSAFSSETYRQRLNEPTPWTREALPQFRDAFRNVYQLEALAGARELWPSPYLLAVRLGAVEPQGAWQEELVGWLVQLAALPYVSRTRLFRLESAGSQLNTQEKSLHGSGPGHEPYLVLVECSVPEPQTCPDWPLHPSTPIWIEENFWIEFALDKPPEVRR